MIRLQSLTRRYGELTTVNDVSFSIGSGEMVGLPGHNDAGKATTAITLERMDGRWDLPSLDGLPAAPSQVEG